jgi:hypothetical protein
MEDELGSRVPCLVQKGDAGPLSGLSTPLLRQSAGGDSEARAEKRKAAFQKTAKSKTTKRRKAA